jgi:coenzyme Q-binding protein COQ10
LTFLDLFTGSLCFIYFILFFGGTDMQAVAVSSTPLFKMLETTWRFQPATSTSRARTDLVGADDTGPTLLSLDLAFEFANPVHAVVSSSFFGKVSSLMVKAFEERCVRVYGPG